LIFPVTLCVAGLLVAAIIYLIASMIDSLQESKYEHVASEVIIVDADVEALVCGGAARFSVGALPPQRRTVRLRYQQLKAAVCRPFAG
jgi:hypothetical protein